MPNPLQVDDPRYASDPDNPLSQYQLDSLNSLALGPLYAPREIVGSFGAGAGPISPNSLLMGKTAPIAPAAKMPVLYHGTNEASLSMHGSEMSLTPDRTQAMGYANNYHKIDDDGGVDEPSLPVVHQIQANPGPVLDINADMLRYQSGKEGHNADAFISKLAQGARSDGYRYMQFDHPNMPLPGADPDGTHQVVISLHPDDDLGYPLSVMEQEAAKAKRLAK